MNSVMSDYRLLLQCLSPATDKRVLITLLACLSSDDWRKLVEQSARLGLAPLLFGVLRPLAGEVAIPVAQLARLAALHDAATLTNLALFGELRRLVSVFRAADIEVIPLKGPHLALGVYRDLGQRPMGDLDLLLRKEDFARAEALLLGLGYSTAYQNREFWETRYFHLRYAAERPEGTLHVELHWAVEPEGSHLAIDEEDLRQRAALARLAGLSVRVLAPEDLLLYLCLHVAYQHVFNYHALRSAYDVVAVIEHFGDCLDWQQIIARARLWRLDRCVYLTLVVARDWFGIAIPLPAAAGLEAPDLDGRFLSWIAERALFDREPQLHNEVTNFIAEFDDVFAARGLVPRIVAAARICFPGVENMRRLYAGSKGKPLCFRYPQRLYDLWQAHHPVLLRLLARQPAVVTAFRYELRGRAMLAWMLGNDHTRVMDAKPPRQLSSGSFARP